MAVRDLLRADARRLWPSASGGVLSIIRIVLREPPFLAVVLLRAQQAQTDRVARLLRLVNVWATGADFAPGCQVGPGLRVLHSQGIVVGRDVVIGADCNLYHGVTLGERRGDGYPRIGNRVTLGAKCSVLGPVTVGDDAAVGAHALVLDDVTAGTSVGGAPARRLRS